MRLFTIILTVRRSLHKTITTVQIGNKIQSLPSAEMHFKGYQSCSNQVSIFQTLLVSLSLHCGSARKNTIIRTIKAILHCLKNFEIHVYVE